MPKHRPAYLIRYIRPAKAKLILLVSTSDLCSRLHVLFLGFFDPVTSIFTEFFMYVAENVRNTGPVSNQISVNLNGALRFLKIVATHIWEGQQV